MNEVSSFVLFFRLSKNSCFSVLFLWCYPSLFLFFPNSIFSVLVPNSIFSVLVPLPYHPCPASLSVLVPSPYPSLSLHLIRPYPSNLSVLVPPPAVIVLSPYSSLSLAPSFPFLSLHLIRSYPSTVSVLVPVLTPPFIFLILYRSILYSKKKGKKGICFFAWQNHMENEI